MKKTGPPGETLLKVHVAYSKEKLKQDKDPFLEEERKMIRSIANQLSLKIDRIRTKNKLPEKQHFLDKICQLSEIGTWELDVSTSIIYWSPFIKKLHGIEPDVDPPLESAFQLVKEGDSRQKMKKAMADAVEKGMPFDVEVELITGEGTIIWTRIVGEPELDNGACKRLCGTLQLIEKKKQIEIELEKNRAKLHKLISQSPDVICTIDAEGRFAEMSDKSYAILGYKPDELIGERYIDYVYEEDLQKSTTAHQEIIDGHEMNNFENRYVTCPRHNLRGKPLVLR